MDAVTWKTLDYAEKRWREADANEREIREARALLRFLLEDNARELIDAARPKCMWCKGRGEVGGGDWWRGTYTTKVCTTCGGLGWAA